MTSTPLTSTDRPRTMTYDAGGRLVSSVEMGQFNTITYTAAYDGDGEMVYESSTASPGTSESAYIVRSSVLGGEVLTRLDQSGNKKITYVPAEGLLFATQRASGGPGPHVLATYRDPLGITETTRAVYDPLGNYIPFQANGDPRPPAGSYSSASMSGLSSSHANAESYGVGCISDGIPTSCKKVMEHLERGRAKKLEVLGPAITPFITRLMMSLTRVGSAFVSVGPKKLMWAGELSNGKGLKIYSGAAELWTYYISAPGMQRGSEQNPSPQPQKTIVGTDDLKAYRARIEEMLKNKACRDFLEQLFNEARAQTGRAFSDILTTFDSVRFYWANTGGSFGGKAYWEEMGTVRAADIMNTINTERIGGSRANQADRRGFLISETTQAFLAETLHHTSQGGRMYGDGEMANALNAILVRQGRDTRKEFSDLTATDVYNAGLYWHRRVESACPAPRK